MQAINALPAQAVTPTQVQTSTLELKDIHVPEPISNFPIAYGWWLLAVLLILIAVISIIKIRKSAKRNHVKKQALVQLKNNPNMSITNTIALLKWAAMHYFSRAELAKLFGDSLQTFLTAQLPIKHQENFTSLTEPAFLNQYQTHNDINDDELVDEKLSQAATLWLTHALPPKISKVKISKVKVSKVKKNSQGVNP